MTVTTDGIPRAARIWAIFPFTQANSQTSATSGRTLSSGARVWTTWGEVVSDYAIGSGASTYCSGYEVWFEVSGGTGAAEATIVGRCVRLGAGLELADRAAFLCGRHSSWCLVRADAAGSVTDDATDGWAAAMVGALNDEAEVRTVSSLPRI